MLEAGTPQPTEHFVRTTLGVCWVRLERSGLDLDERGGFTARWADGAEAEEVLELDTYRKMVKTYLAELYKMRHGHEPGGITLNLASHQLIDDLEGWTKLNWRPRE